MAQKDNSFIDEVRWADLDNFLVEHYTELKGLDEQIKQHYAQFMSAFNQLGLDPLLFGMDNQDEVQQAYLLALTSQFLVVVTQVNHDEKSLETLKKISVLIHRKTLWPSRQQAFPAGKSSH